MDCLHLSPISRRGVIIVYLKGVSCFKAIMYVVMYVSEWGKDSHTQEKVGCLPLRRKDRHFLYTGETEQCGHILEHDSQGVLPVSLLSDLCLHFRSSVCAPGHFQCLRPPLRMPWVICQFPVLVSADLFKCTQPESNE